MTESEAKKYMLIEKECINRDCNRDCANCDIVQDVEDLNNAYDVAINALEKQIAKKPIKSENQVVRYVNTYYCPTCELGITGTNIAKWCYHCGQKLDWSEEE